MSYFIYPTEYLKRFGEYECRFSLDAEPLMDWYINSNIILSFKPVVIVFSFHDSDMSVLSCVLITILVLSQHVISLQYLRKTTYSLFHLLVSSLYK